MKIRGGPALALAAALLSASGAIEGWGLDVHRRITARALDALPPDARTFFTAERAFIIEHSVDPDLWRVVDLGGELGDEPPNHYLDIDDLGEPPPYTNVPREWDAFVARYGEDAAHDAGRLPWRTEEIFERLVDTLADARAGRGRYAASDARYLAAVLAHYVQDGFVPFHAVRNYDGQFTGQRGIHSRFETVLVSDYWGTFSLRPVVVTRIDDIRTFMFDTLAASAALAPPILAADKEAAGSAPDYDLAYYTAFRTAVGPIAEGRLSDAADAVASALSTAWELAAPD